MLLSAKLSGLQSAIRIRAFHALMGACLLQGPVWAKLRPLDGPPAYAQENRVEQLQTLPDLEPGEHVFALLKVSHFTDETQQFVVEIRKSESRVFIYSKWDFIPIIQNVRSADETNEFLAEILKQRADALPHLLDQGVNDLPEIAYYHWTAERGHVLLIHGELGEDLDSRARHGRQDTRPYERLMRTIWKLAGVWVGND